MHESTNPTDSEKARTETSRRLTLVWAQAGMVSHDEQVQVDNILVIYAWPALRS